MKKLLLIALLSLNIAAVVAEEDHVRTDCEAITSTSQIKTAPAGSDSDSTAPAVGVGR
ncbi:hypothetical protein N9O57_02030 [bacterium]|nr:hypothetical protein [bacterium]